MHHRIIGAMVLALVGTKEIGAEGISATLSELVDGADRITVGDVSAMRRVIENQVVHTRNGEEITGKFVFTYVDVTPTEHIVGGQMSTVTVRLLGGVHPDGTKVTTYLQAPSLSSEEKVLLFLKQAPEARSQPGGGASNRLPPCRQVPRRRRGRRGAPGAPPAQQLAEDRSEPGHRREPDPAVEDEAVDPSRTDTK